MKSYSLFRTDSLYISCLGDRGQNEVDGLLLMTPLVSDIMGHWLLGTYSKPVQGPPLQT